MAVMFPGGEQNTTCRRPQHASQKIDKRRFAGTIRTDQCVARAGFELEIEIVYRPERTKVSLHHLCL